MCDQDPPVSYLESIYKVEKAGIFLLFQIRLEGGIPLPPRVAARGFDPPGADKPSTNKKWHFIKGLYLVGTPRGRLTHIDKDFFARSWDQVREEVEVKLLAQEQEMYVLARSRTKICNCCFVSCT